MIAAAGASILVNAFWGESIASLTASQLLPNISIQAVGIFTGSLILLARFKMNPIHVMLLSGVTEGGAAAYFQTISLKNFRISSQKRLMQNM